MKTKTIVFTAPRTVELREMETPELGKDLVRVKTEYTVVSGGTEKANLCFYKKFPAYPGYCGIGTVEEIGPEVRNISVGDRVLVYHGRHAARNTVPEQNVTKVEDDGIPSEDAVFVIMASMGLGGVRKLAIEVGESAMVMGLGLLGLFAVGFCRLSGACPVIAVDPNPERRSLALKLGADEALDPGEPDFSERVKALTGGKGVNAVVEVTGISAALKQALSCTARLGRVALLGCTRVSDTCIDFYREVHLPGITLIGAHNYFPRPKSDSYPRNWTHQDDCKAILKLVSAGRISMHPILSRIVKPDDAARIYGELCNDPAFPVGTVFDWRDEA